MREKIKRNLPTIIVVISFLKTSRKRSNRVRIGCRNRLGISFNQVVLAQTVHYVVTSCREVSSVFITQSCRFHYSILKSVVGGQTDIARLISFPGTATKSIIIYRRRRAPHEWKGSENIIVQPIDVRNDSAGRKTSHTTGLWSKCTKFCRIFQTNCF